LDEKGNMQFWKKSISGSPAKEARRNGTQIADIA
jgi:hypothetical protein